MTTAEAAQLREEFKEDLKATEGRILEAIRADKVVIDERIDRESEHTTRHFSTLADERSECRTHCDAVRAPVYARLVELEKSSAIVRILVPAIIGCGATIVTLFLKEVIAGLFGG